MESSTHEQNRAESPEMTVIKMTRKNLASVGICPNLVTKPYPFNDKILIGFMIMSLTIICSLMYSFYETTTIAENMLLTFFDSSIVFISVSLLILILNVEKLFGFIDGCENSANTSECRINTSLHFKSKPIGIFCYICI